MEPAEALLRSYEGFEDPASFASREAVDQYRSALLERTAPQAQAIAARFKGRGGSFLEVCSGNGRLLHALLAMGMIARGVGWEISSSRVAFAQAWASDVGLAESATHIETDALSPPPPGPLFDAAACITSALGYFDILDEDGAAKLLRIIRARLKPGGLLVLELYQHPTERRLASTAGGTVRTWRELPASDPWRFYLSELSWDTATSVLHHRKTFIHRTSGKVDDSRQEALRIWTLEELGGLLERTGFAVEEAAGSWTGTAYVEGATPELILFARSSSAANRSSR